MSFDKTHSYRIFTLPTTVNKLLEQLDDSKHRFGRTEAKRIEGLLERLESKIFENPESLLRLHESLLFLLAYPQSASILRAAEAQLTTFPKRIALLRNKGVDIAELGDPSVSGIAGMPVTDTFSFYIVQWLVSSHADQVSFFWEWFEEENRIAETWPRFMPLLEEDAFVEANVPYGEWLRAARGRRPELSWLMRRFEQLPVDVKLKAELYDSQKLYVEWTPAYRASRTGMRLAASGQKIFFHREPLIQRRDVSLRDELDKPSPPIERLSSREGEAMLDVAREASTIRYRELYGFTHGDPASVSRVDIGRGVLLFVMGLPPHKRLPLRTYHAAMIFKNGVPIGYFEGLSICERMESGFNLYYTFRDGETTWLYARTLNVMRHMFGVTAFSLDPYQLGHENEEGIESGAFWFYRKLGFRPTSKTILKATEKEEKKISTSKSYRTPASTLRKLAASSMIFELDQHRAGDWDRFQVRGVGFAVQRRMAAMFGGEADRMRQVSNNQIARLLGVSTQRWTTAQLAAFSDFSLVLSLVPDLGKWGNEELRGLVDIIRAKAGRDEVLYLKHMQKHERLRRAIIDLGSG